MSVLNSFFQAKKSGKFLLGILVDPDDDLKKTEEVAETALLHGVEWFLVGGSILTKGRTESCVNTLRSAGVQNIILFPGNEIQVVDNADAILFISLISGRNAEFLIGKQVNAAPWIKKSRLESIPTGYMLVESGKLNSAIYMSNTVPLPSDKPEIAAATAMAGELMGMKAMYLDAGSGATHPVPAPLITAVSKSTACFVIAGGGIRTAKQAENAWLAGASMVVVGNGAFEDTSMIKELVEVANTLNTSDISLQ